MSLLAARVAALCRSVLAGAARGLVAIGRGIAMASLIPAGLGLAAVLLGWLVVPLYAALVAVEVDYFSPWRLSQQNKLPYGVPGPTPSGGFPDDGLVRVIAVLVAAIAIAVIPLAAPVLLAGVRRVRAGARALASRWTGVPIPDPYQPYQPHPGRGSRIRWLLSDPATWRDLGWTVVNASAGTVLLLGPAALTAVGAFSLLAVLGGQPTVPVGTGAGVQLPFAIALIVAGLWAAPPSLRGYGNLTRSVLTRPSTAELNRRISHLAQTRTETIDAGAAEIRRIERDLHDGAQARLVAIGMALDAAGDLMDSQPETARRLLTDARDNSAKALAELRSLVRGIHPPVLADRGLADALRALALDTPHPISVTSEVAGRLPAPVESAAYFAVSELLANVAKHASATQAWIDIRHADGLLAITVTDDGHGGADPASGTGLRGVQRRLAAFDGGLTIASPPGGPTTISLELPCASS